MPPLPMMRITFCFLLFPFCLEEFTTVCFFTPLAFVYIPRYGMVAHHFIYPGFALSRKPPPRRAVPSDPWKRTRGTADDQSRSMEGSKLWWSFALGPELALEGAREGKSCSPGLWVGEREDTLFARADTLFAALALSSHRFLDQKGQDMEKKPKKSIIYKDQKQGKNQKKNP
jgi:hypothetical protein